MLPRPAELAKWHKLQRKNLNILGLPKRVVSVSQSEQLAMSRELLLSKEKEQTHLSSAPDREVGESQSEREPHLGEKKEIKSRAWGGKSGLHSEGWQTPKREREGGQAKRTSLGKVGENMSG